MPSNFRTRLKQGEILYGTMLTLPLPAVAEILAAVGFDWLFVDGEHAPFQAAEITAVLQAVGDRLACIVRVPSADEAAIKCTLDLGPAGIIVPQIKSAEEARRVVQYARYAPLGARGVGLGRAQGYGLTFEEYLRTANEQVTLIVQAEHIRAVEEIEDIVRIPGIDAVLLGPYDLSASMGLMGDVDHPDVQRAIQQVADACRSADMPLGIFGVTAESLRPAVESGCRLIVAGVDTLLLARSAGEILRALRSCG